MEHSDALRCPAWFHRQFAETLAWCSGRASLDDPEQCLRSRELQPSFGSSPEGARWLEVDPGMIETLVRTRRSLLAASGSPGGSCPPYEKGRLLACQYECTNFNGITAHNSGYYFDNNDVPPWDTWVGEVVGEGPSERTSTSWRLAIRAFREMVPPDWGMRLLVAWVPEPFAPRVTAAIDCECAGMLWWADDPVEQYPAVPEWLREFAGQLR